MKYIAVDLSKMLFEMPEVKCISSQEKEKGSLEPGMLADMALLNQNQNAIPVEELKNVQVGMAMVDGKIVYQA